MTDIKIQCQKLHHATQTVWEFGVQIADGSDADNLFQDCHDPRIMGAVYIGPYNAEAATPDHADVVWENPVGI